MRILSSLEKAINRLLRKTESFGSSLPRPDLNERHREDLNDRLIQHNRELLESRVKRENELKKIKLRLAKCSARLADRDAECDRLMSENRRLQDQIERHIAQAAEDAKTILAAMRSVDPNSRQD